jgi:L-fucose isomerase-like protein
MKSISKLKIGLAGVMCTPFRGDKETQYRTSGAGLHDLAKQFGFDLKIVQQGIYNAEQAQATANELDEWGADFVLLQASSFAGGEFIYAFTALPANLGLWWVPEGPPDHDGALPLNSMAALNMYNSIIKTYLKHYDRPVKWFYGPAGQPLFDERLVPTVQALTAIKNLRGSQIGLVGGVAPGFDNLIIDERDLNARLGIRVTPIDFDQVIRLAKEIERQPVERAVRALQVSASHIQPGQEQAFEKSGRVMAALEEIAQQRGLEALALSCWPRFQSDYHLAVCSVVGLANTEGLVVACEGDVTSAASMLMLRYLSGGRVVTLMDLVAFEEADESILFWHCGPTSPVLADEEGVQLGSLWLFDGYGGDPVGLHNDLVLKPGSATVAGFSTDFQRMLILEGEIDNRKPSYKGSRGWMKALKLNGKPISTRDLLETLLASGYQHHYPLVYGILAAGALELAAWLGIRPILAQPYQPWLNGSKYWEV